MIRIIKFKEENVEITKGGKGPVGSSTKAPNGEYVHHRKKSPKKYSKYFTKKTKDGKLLRMGYNISTKKWEVQSVLNPTKEDNSLKEKFLDANHIKNSYYDNYTEFYINPKLLNIKNESSLTIVHNSPMIGFEDEEKNNLCLYLGHKIIDYFDKYYSEFSKGYVLAVRGDDIELTIEDNFHNSYEWIGDVKTDKQLDGVCSVLINDDIVYSNWNMNNCITAIQKAMNYGKHIYLLTGQVIEYGKDQHNDEVVLKDHHILEVLY